MPFRPEWNRMAPIPIPCWFSLKLESFDPDLIMQYIPPMHRLGGKWREGLNPIFCPQGGWQICRRLRNGWLHKVAVFSLTDRHGRMVPPTAETLRILRYCRAMYRSRQYRRMEDQLEQSIEEIKKAREHQSRERLMTAIDRFQTMHGKRQFPNRVFYPNSLVNLNGN